MLPRLLFPTSPAALTGMAAAVINAALRVALIPLFVVPTFDRVLAQAELGQLPRILLVSGLVVVAGAAMLFVQDAFLGRSAASVSARWREALYERLLAQRPNTLPGTSGGLSSRILSDLKEVETFQQYGLGTLIAETFTLVGITLVLFYSNSRATLLLVGLGLPLILILRLMGRNLRRAAHGAQGGLEDLGAQLQEGLRQHAVIRAFLAQGFMLGRFRPVNARTEQATRQRSLLAALQTPVAQLLMFTAIGALVFVLVRSAALGRMTTGEVVSYLTLVALISTPAQLLPKAVAMLQQARAARERLLSLLDEAGASASADTPTDVDTAKGIRLERLSFRYLPELSVLEGVTLELPPRGLVALTGESGRGKSTLLYLLLRFLEPTGGRILLAGRPLNSWAEHELRGHIAYVPQAPTMLRASLRDNLLLGRDLPEARLWEVLVEVGLAELVKGLPDGLEHRLFEEGVGFSGGQNQRLAVARALLSDPAVLLLDEPSSNLDEKSELTLLETLKRQATRRLVLIVAHRPQLIEAADLVLYLNAAGNLRVSQERPTHV